MIAAGWVFTVIGAIISLVSFISMQDYQSKSYGYGSYTHKSEIESSQMIMIVGLFIIVIGVIFLAVGYSQRNRTVQKTTYNRPREVYMKIPCRKCGFPILPNSKFCQNCGSAMNVTVQTSVSPNTVKKICPQCQKTVEESDGFCSNCGFKLN